MKKIFCLTVALCLLLMSLLMTGCGSFFGDESLQIARMYQEGSKLMVEFTDGSTQPFDLKKGEQGDKGIDGLNGNGIKEIQLDYQEKKSKTVVTIIYTDDRDPEVFEIRDGRHIVGMTTDYNEETDLTNVYFQFSDGTVSDPPIPVARGKRGNGIASFEFLANEDQSVSMKLVLDDGDTYTHLIPAPERGNGVASMVATETEDSYYITVYYTDGTSETLPFTRPTEPSQWYEGTDPPDEEFGKVGDYFFDSYEQVIYTKKPPEEGGWSEIISFQRQNETYTVTFIYSASDGTGSIQSSYEVVRGSYFPGDIPVPERQGYRFLGWYTKKEINPTMSPFTDLTPVFSDLKLYAVWEPLN